jgi:hypothetical protein
MGVKYSVLPIGEMMKATEARWRGNSPARKPDATEENIQSRCRMLLLMGISNKTGKMLLTTGNKSEMAVGYATLYGDMAGGFAPIKDCSKLLVYKLAEYRTRVSPVIPRRVIDRPPPPNCAPTRRTATRCRLTKSSTHSRGLHRRRPVRGRDLRARFRPPDRRACAGSRETQRIQAPPGAAGCTSFAPCLRSRLALPRSPSYGCT